MKTKLKPIYMVNVVVELSGAASKLAATVTITVAVLISWQQLQPKLS